MRNLPFPLRVASRTHVHGQSTVGRISINARITEDYEPRWMDTFVSVTHRHRKAIGTETLTANVIDYLNELHASMVHVEYEYPYFIEKATPAAHEICLVRYRCSYSAEAVAGHTNPKIRFRIDVPVVTSAPHANSTHVDGASGQLSIACVDVETSQTVFAEDIIALVERHALFPWFSYLTPEDHELLMQKIHTERKESSVLVEEVREELSRGHALGRFSVNCANFDLPRSLPSLYHADKEPWNLESDIAEYELY